MPQNDPASQDSSLRDLQVFHSVARALTSSLDRDTILRAIMQQMERFFEPETWSLLLVDEQQAELFYAVAGGTMAEGLIEAALRQARIPIGQGFAGWVAENGESLIVPEVEKGDDRFLYLAAQASGGRKVRSAIWMPLRSRRETLGVIQLINCRAETLSDYTISFLHVLCDYAAIAIDNARAVERIQELTITDDCTGLYNLRHLYRQMEGEIERSRRFGSTFSLIFIDLDHFKDVNDQHGHLVGSQLLADVGQALRSQVRGVDSVYRYGGDEFTVLLPESNKGAARETAMRLSQFMRDRSFPIGDGIELSVRASMGIASYPEDGLTAQDIIRAADEMMYLVKGLTRDNIAIAGQGVLQRP